MLWLCDKGCVVKKIENERGIRFKVDVLAGRAGTENHPGLQGKEWQGSKGIRQWLINCCTSQMITHKINHCVD